MGGLWHQTCHRIHIFLWKGEWNENHGVGTGILCIRETYRQLRGLSLIVIECHT
jgi:hypothetical protein